MPFATVEEAIAATRSGEMVIIVDDRDRENEGDLALAAEKVTPEIVNFMLAHGRGIICVPIIADRLEELDIPPMVAENSEVNRTAFTVTVDAKYGITTGVAVQDRVTTIKTLIDPRTKPRDLARPGHVFPLRACKGGVLRRAGHTEASVDLAQLAGLYPASVICEVMTEDGSMARLPQLEDLAERFSFKIVTIRDLVAHRRRTERLVHRVNRVPFPSELGTFDLVFYETDVIDEAYLALVKGEIAGDEPTLVRVHSGCITGDVFLSQRCDCGEQLRKAMMMIEAAGKGVILYIPHHEGRGIGLHMKMRAYELQEHGADTVEANAMLGFAPDLRDYGLGAQVLVDLGVCKMRLLTNNPKKLVALDGYGLEVVEQIPIEVPATPTNLRYLKSKQKKLGHTLKLN